MRPYEPDFIGDKAQRNPWDMKKHPEHYKYIQALIERADIETVPPPKYTEETKLEVYRLRDKGHTLREIAEKVGVSKSTACLYIQKHKKLLAQTHKVTITQPGTTKVVETVYSINEVNVGKLTSKSDKKVFKS